MSKAPVSAFKDSLSSLFTPKQLVHIECLPQMWEYQCCILKDSYYYYIDREIKDLKKKAFLAQCYRDYSYQAGIGPHM